MISLRLSDQEYQELKNRCAVTGDINVSEFVRAATLNALASPKLIPPPTYLEIQVATLFNRLDKLEKKLAGMLTNAASCTGANQQVYSNRES